MPETASYDSLAVALTDATTTEVVFENEYSGLVNDAKVSGRMWDLSCKAVGITP